VISFNSSFHCFYCFVPVAAARGSLSGWWEGAFSGVCVTVRWHRTVRHSSLRASAERAVPKRASTAFSVFFKMFFHLCVSGCGRFLTSSDGHDRCLTCLGKQHAESTLVDDTCPHCEGMSMLALRSQLSFFNTEVRVPSVAT